MRYVLSVYRTFFLKSGLVWGSTDNSSPLSLLYISVSSFCDLYVSLYIVSCFLGLLENTSSQPLARRYVKRFLFHETSWLNSSNFFLVKYFSDFRNRSISRSAAFMSCLRR